MIKINKYIIILGTLLAVLLVISFFMFLPRKEVLSQVDTNSYYFVPVSPKVRSEPLILPPVIIFEGMNTFSCYKTVGVSMTPAISDGSIICSIKIDYKDVVVGDIVLVDDVDNKRILSHQIVQKTDTYFRTKAFINPYIMDSPIWKPEQFKGVIIAILY